MSRRAGRSLVDETPHLIAAFEYVTEWSAAIDVGANIGMWSRLMAERFVDVHAFEPHPVAFTALIDDLPDNVIAHGLAVSDETGFSYIGTKHETGKHTGAHLKCHRQWSTRVPVIRLDDMFGTRYHDPVGLLKIDVEGWEYAVLRGAARLLEQHRPVVIVEDVAKHRRRFSHEDQATKLGRFMRDRDYRVVETIGVDVICVPR